MENTTPIDQVDMPVEEAYELATGGQRLANLIIDSVIVFLLNTGRQFIFPTVGIWSNLGYNLVLSFTYYVLMESSTGRTIGKYVTNTLVVDKNSISRPSLNQVLGRSICRFIPLEAFSFLGSEPVGWHDSITNTYVVKARSLKNQLE